MLLCLRQLGIGVCQCRAGLIALFDQARPVTAVLIVVQAPIDLELLQFCQGTFRSLYTGRL